MNDWSEPAYPHNETDHAHGATSTRKPGLTIRQQAVLMAMQGILANPTTHYWQVESVKHAAINVADAVLRAERESRE